MADHAVDLLLAVLLLMTTVWCALVHQRLRRLRVDREDISGFVDALVTATGRAEQVVGELRENATESHALLGERHAAIHRERDELTRLVEHAARMAKRLESEVTRGTRMLAEQRSMPDPGPRAEPAMVAARVAVPEPASERAAPRRPQLPKIESASDHAAALRSSTPEPTPQAGSMDRMMSVLRAAAQGGALPAEALATGRSAEDSPAPVEDEGRKSKRQRMGHELLRALQALR